MTFRVHLFITGLLFLTLKINARTFLKNAHGNADLRFKTKLQKHAIDELLELYREEIKEDDHKVVKIAKKLFNGCLNEPQIEEDALKTLRKVFEQVGDWPILEGSKWKEEDFDWVNATYKLRDLGYHSGVFKAKLFYVSYGDYTSEDLQAMTEMVMKFEPERKEDVVKELEGASQLSKTLEQYLSREKRNKIEEMAKAMKTVFVKMVNDTELLVEAEKTDIVERFKTLRIQIGLPGDYFDDKIFDYADVDLVDVENGTFFDLLARAQSNSKASEYRLVKKSIDNLPLLHYILPNNKGYVYGVNTIYIPAFMTRNMV
ncbi:hypothetical protein ILUMI_01794 [Ignelater luminosus]|uniref:Peptidase M13 N-terminal domain-containing protein n=1 Tax=Ignelater luminosus TaxID=2038154 RepID=A0A8K0DDV9_IGNLU|nr:hypothetical protein ILUMI_01794 [Ignelater luminosus]